MSYLIFCSAAFTAGYFVGKEHGFLNLFDISEEFKTKCRKISSWFSKEFFGVEEKEHKKSNLSAK